MKNKNFNDWAIALAVIACSVVLFVALSMALSGTMLGKPSRVVNINFHDVMGVNLGAQVKYAGAPIGKVVSIRILTPEERTASGDPQNTVRVTFAMGASVPALPADVVASVAADTMLSDKLILLSGGTPGGPALTDSIVLQGITPTTFDKLARNLDSILDGISSIMSGTKDNSGDVFDRLHVLLNDTQGLLAEAKPVVQDARALASDARQLIADTKEPIVRTIGRLDVAAGSIDQLANKANSLVANNEKKLTATINDFKVISENFKVTSTYTKILARNLTLRPSQLVWGGGKPPPLPSEQEILRAVRPIPAE